MTRRKQRSEMPRRGLRALRDLLVRNVNREVVPFNPIYVLSDGIIRAIDAMAEHLTGEQDYFSTKAHGGSYQSQHEADRAARERGDIPWEW